LDQLLEEAGMEGVERVKVAVERGVEALRLRPTMGKGTAVTRARLRSGLACDIEDGRWRMAADLSERGGGSGSAPDPGVYGRSALAACLAMGYTIWAARLGIPIDALEVAVEADYDVRAENGLIDDPPGYSAVRCRVTVESGAPRADLERLVSIAERYSPWLDVFRRPTPVTTELRITDPAER
jgi:uncharacterized OsmC-like protein